MFYIPINLYLERLSDEPDHSKEFFVFVSMTESEIWEAYGCNLPINLWGCHKRYEENNHPCDLCPPQNYLNVIKHADPLLRFYHNLQKTIRTLNKGSSLETKRKVHTQWWKRLASSRGSNLHYQPWLLRRAWILMEILSTDACKYIQQKNDPLWTQIIMKINLQGSLKINL